MAITPQELQNMLDELEVESVAQASLDKLARVRWVLEGGAGLELPPAARKTIDLEGNLSREACASLGGAQPT